VKTEKVARYSIAVKQTGNCTSALNVETPCPTLKKSVGVHPGWLEDQAKLSLRK
jgi:hypothetical protein